MSSTATDTLTRTKVKTPSMWKIVLHNDNFTPMDFVTQILIQVFHKGEAEAVLIMRTVHEKGRGVVGLFTKDVAETKVIQVRSIAETYGHPLLTTAEEA